MRRPGLKSLLQFIPKVFYQVEVQTSKGLPPQTRSFMSLWTLLCALAKSSGGGGIMVWGCFSGVWLGPLVPVKGTLKTSAYQDMLDNFILPTLWEQSGDGPFLFKHD